MSDDMLDVPKHVIPQTVCNSEAQPLGDNIVVGSITKAVAHLPNALPAVPLSISDGTPQTVVTSMSGGTPQTVVTSMSGGTPQTVVSDAQLQLGGLDCLAQSTNATPPLLEQTLQLPGPTLHAGDGPRSPSLTATGQTSVSLNQWGNFNWDPSLMPTNWQFDNTWFNNGNTHGLRNGDNASLLDELQQPLFAFENSGSLQPQHGHLTEAT